MLPDFLHHFFRINLGGTVTRSNSITMTDSIQYPTQSWTWSQGAHLRLQVPDVVESDLSVNYTLTRSKYSSDQNLPTTFKSASFIFQSKHYFLSHWILNYRLSMPYISNGNRLETIPPSLSASLQRKFMAHHAASLTLSVYNILNQSATVGQSQTPITLTQTTPSLTGRYFLLNFQWKLERFRE